MKLSSFYLLVAIFLVFGYPTVEALTKDDIPIIKCTSNRTDKRKGELALCAIFRDEGPYLIEWIEYHRLVGVSHFYLYNNMSKDNFWGVLQPYVNQGIVELFDVPFDSTLYQDGAKTHNFVQVCCYNHAIRLSRKSNNWIAIIDADEFICPVVDGTITKALKRYDYAEGIVVYWQLYGTSNIWDLLPRELMIEKLLMKAPNNSGQGLFKSIVKPKTAECRDPHWTTVSGNGLFMPNHQRFSHTPNLSSLPVDIIRINHYTYRTQSFYENVKKPRRAIWGDIPSPEEEKRRLDWVNTEYDPVMLQFVPKLKARIFGR